MEERTLLSGTVRTFDGAENNVANPTWGAARTQLLRNTPAAYDNGFSSPAGAGRPSARVISNAVAAQEGSITNNRSLSDLVVQWSQFLTHDLDLTPIAFNSFSIPVPRGDPFFDPEGTGTRSIPFRRSEFDASTGLGPGNPRQQITNVTAYIDASQIYGSDLTRANALRTFSGGKLKTSAGDLLPFNTLFLANDNRGPFPAERLFLSGDVRTNEQVGLTALNTLFVREHNRLADEIAAANPTWTDEEIYQRARKTVGALLQVITYNEFLPALLGPHAPSPSGRYDPSVNASVLNEFSTAAFRLGHSMVSPTLLRVGNDGQTTSIPLADAFFNPTHLSTSADLDDLLRGIASQQAQEVDTRVDDAARNFLFGPPGAGGLDLAALDIQRGRDHGLADYNTTRAAFGFARVTSFAEITSDMELQAQLAGLYGSVDDIDLWVGLLAEDHLPGASVGPTMAAILNDQFRRLRDGDRFWYENDSEFSPEDFARLRSTTLADVIRRNTGIANLQPNVFFVGAPPAVSVQPASQTAGVGKSVTFSVVAEGSGPLSYQWRRNGVNIPDATAASYTLTPVTPSDNGALFTVVVSNAAGSVTSAAAILTVLASTGEARGPGYWKNHTAAWEPTGYSPDQTVASVFGWDAVAPYGSLGQMTLLQVLPKNKGGATSLVRQGIAALLNAAHPTIQFPLTVAQVVQQVEDALHSQRSGTINALKGLLEEYNEGNHDDDDDD